MQDIRHITAIVNPIAGTGGKAKLPRLIERNISNEIFQVDVKFTKAAGHATELAREALNQGHYGVIAVGGDGTVNEVATTLRGTETPLGVIPCGSGNGLARHLHIPMDIERALRIINDDIVETVDFCSVNEKPFFCTCGVGFDAQVSYKFANEDTRGLVTYVRTTIGEYFRYHAQDYIVTIDNQQLHEKAFVIACCNAAQYGNNAFMAPRASMKDGKIDITIIHSFNLGEAAILGARLFTSTIDRDKHVSIYRGQDIVIERACEDVMHIDGEPLIMPARLHIKCHPSGLKVFVPAAGKDI